MTAMARSDFTLRDPSALGALLVYDWRLRNLLTDLEIVKAIDRPVTTGILRHLQRLGLIRSVHGVRAQGGRMRLWPLMEALRVQIVLDLRQATGRRLADCVDIMDENSTLVAAEIDTWESYVGEAYDPDEALIWKGKVANVLASKSTLKAQVRGSVRGFVQRNAFDGVSQPAFLL
jgi:hypothetical protein